MFKKSMLVMLAALALLSVPFAATAQTERQLVPVTLEDLTAKAELYVGQTVILEGVAEEFVSVKSFLLGEAAALDNDQVLVINTSGDPLPVNIFKGDTLIVTGVVHPSLTMRLEAGEVTLPEDRFAYRRTWVLDTPVEVTVTPDATATTAPTATATTASKTATPTATATDDADETATPDADAALTTPDVSTRQWSDAFDFYFGGGYPDAYDGFVVIEVTSVRDIAFGITE